MEKVISEWRVVETDDGFRIEIKGDKKAMREWMEQVRSHGPMRMRRHMPFGPWGACGRRGFWHYGEEEEEHSKEERQA